MDCIYSESRVVRLVSVAINTPSENQNTNNNMCLIDASTVDNARTGRPMRFVMMAVDHASKFALAMCGLIVLLLIASCLIAWGNAVNPVRNDPVGARDVLNAPDMRVFWVFLSLFLCALGIIGVFSVAVGTLCAVWYLFTNTIERVEHIWDEKPLDTQAREKIA